MGKKALGLRVTTVLILFSLVLSGCGGGGGGGPVSSQTATPSAAVTTAGGSAAPAATDTRTAEQNTNLTRVAMYGMLRTPTKTRPAEPAATEPAASGTSVAPAPTATVTATTETGAAMVAATAATTGTAVAGADGQKIFQDNCATCHNLDKTKKVGPGLGGLFALVVLSNGKPVTDGNVAAAIHTLHAPTNTFSSLQGADMAALLAYLEQATKQ
jgi:mono/diheme cytochrome c family protein